MSTDAQLEAMVKRLDAEVARLDELVAAKSARVAELEAALKGILHSEIGCEWGGTNSEEERAVDRAWALFPKT